MAKFNVFSVAALVVCFVVVSVTADLKDASGNPCPPCPSNRMFLPVCGSNGQTYTNPSLLECHSKCLKTEIKIKRYGPCLADLLRNADGIVCPPCAVTADLNPVCGTNGKTYPNKSALGCENKCKKSNITVKHAGECA